ARECPQAVPAGVQAVQGICAAAGQTMSHVKFPATIPSDNTAKVTNPGAPKGTAASPSPAPPSSDAPTGTAASPSPATPSHDGNITTPEASTGTAASPSPAPSSPGTAGAASKSAASASFAPLMGLTVFVPMALPFGIAVLM
ncbi:unnamed protein product, partial [Tilletia controversa]